MPFNVEGGFNQEGVAPPSPGDKTLIKKVIKPIVKPIIKKIIN